VHTPHPPRAQLLAESARHFLSGPHQCDRATHDKAQSLIAGYTASLERALTQISTNAQFAQQTGADFDLKRCALLCEQALAGTAS